MFLEFLIKVEESCGYSLTFAHTPVLEYYSFGEERGCRNVMSQNDHVTTKLGHGHTGSKLKVILRISCSVNVEQTRQDIYI